MKTQTRTPLLGLLLLAASACASLAQTTPSYQLTCATEGAGGGTASGGPYTLQGTLGQPVATGPGDGGATPNSMAYAATAGFWTAPPDAARPILRIVSSPGQRVLSWPASATGFHLQSCTDLVRMNWVSNTTPAVTVGPDKVVTESGSGPRFYRLIRP